MPQSIINEMNRIERIGQTSKLEPVGETPGIKRLRAAFDEHMANKANEKAKAEYEAEAIKEGQKEAAATEYPKSMMAAFKDVSRDYDRLKTTKGADKYDKIEQLAEKYPKFKRLRDEIMDYLISRGEDKTRSVQDVWEEMRDKQFAAEKATAKERLAKARTENMKKDTATTSKEVAPSSYSGESIKTSGGAGRYVQYDSGRESTV